MKKLFHFLSLIVSTSITLSSCSATNNSNDGAINDSLSVVNVQSLMATPDSFLNQRMIVQGQCVHICKHGNRKMFLVNENDSVLLRVEASSRMGESFADSMLNTTVAVRGIFREQRINEETLQEYEYKHTAQLANIADTKFRDKLNDRCDIEKIASGQPAFLTFPQQIADFRQRIEARNNAEGRPYISLYYIDASAIVR